jgi:myo-inositol-1-phosphate synthase
MSFEEAVEILFRVLGDELVSFEGMDSLNFEGEYEFLVLKKDWIRQKIHISKNKILYKIPENFLHD